MPRPSNPNALRRTGKHIHLLLPADEHEAYQRDAEARGVSLAEHVRRLLKRWHTRVKRTGTPL